MHRLTSAGVAAVAALAVAGVLVGPAAAAAPAGGQIALYADAGNGGSQKIVFVGAIGDYGKAINVDKNGKVDPNGNFVKVKLQKGTFEIDTTVLNKTLDTAKPQIQSEATCSSQFSGSGTVKLFNGTGLYKGISGTANVTVTFAGVGSRYKSGPKKGQCKHEDANPRAQYGFVTGQGTVSFSS
jgi:hypothetical protein